jgi:hypothetical protein
MIFHASYIHTLSFELEVHFRNNILSKSGNSIDSVNSSTFLKLQSYDFDYSNKQDTVWAKIYYSIFHNCKYNEPTYTLTPRLHEAEHIDQTPHKELYNNGLIHSYLGLVHDKLYTYDFSAA